jgi:hypothetical protein
MMERKVTKKGLVTLGSICFLLFMIPAVAFSWNQATHAYIADRLGARAGGISPSIEEGLEYHT